MSDWTDRAACLGMDTNVFYPETGSRRGNPGAVNSWRRALRTCAQCPVRRECLTAALEHEEPKWVAGRKVIGADGEVKELPGRWSKPLPEGVWGGQRPADRHQASVEHLETVPRAGNGRRICPTKGCRGCRPIPERVALLDEVFTQTVHNRGLLTADEEVA